MTTGRIARPTERRIVGRTLAFSLLLSLGSAASASTGLSDCALRGDEPLNVTTVDYESKTKDNDDAFLLRDDVAKLESLALTKRVDTTVPRKIPETDLKIDVSTTENAAAMLAEQRQQERLKKDESKARVKTALPGIAVDNVTVVRGRMFRTDI